MQNLNRMPGRHSPTCLLAGFLATAAVCAPQTTALPKPSAPGPWPLESQERFLLTADIQSVAPVGKGITHSLKAILTDGRLTHAAQIQTVNIHMPVFHGVDGSQEANFSDCWRYNVAAYRLARLLQLTFMTPVSVVRAYQGKPAAFTWWVDDVLMDDRDRLRNNVEPPDPARWDRQMCLIRLFDQLIYNMDRSQENILIAADWSVWMIDHTRSFRQWTTLRNPAAVTWCTPDLLLALQSLRRQDLDRNLGDLLTPDQIAAIMSRRDLIVAKLSTQP